jgi:hypothetical protein
MNPTIRHLAWVLVFATGAGQAAVTGVIAQPATANAAATGPTSTAITWNVQTSTGGNVSSSQGTFRTLTGVVLGTINTPLAKSGAAGNVSLGESVLVPADVTARALKLGQNALRYERSFRDSEGAGTPGWLTVQVATAAATGFGLSQMALTFENDKPLALVERDARLTAHAKINATGSGIIQAAWEVAGPNPDGNNPAYMIIATVHQATSGTEPVAVKSPALPTNIAGTYLVRLRVTEPAAAIEMPVVHYYVGEKKD